MPSVAELVEGPAHGRGVDAADFDRAVEIAEAGRVELVRVGPDEVAGLVDGVEVRFTVRDGSLVTVPASWTRELIAAALEVWRRTPEHP
ncbi:hypothetical protein QDR37_05500 [Amnibacterium sp. CER49]|uniref:hypothetical protein n=1 Tax=Amnibacterium sp. CER49 TaxID=3039161 RepID=UPI00244691E7|nr:hypothetical protein [Amnibacterium sp. CER49]MDH2443396.1 hypothetical protein [Amnibacterium sp. CER49]